MRVVNELTCEKDSVAKLEREVFGTCTYFAFLLANCIMEAHQILAMTLSSCR